MCVCVCECVSECVLVPGKYVEYELNSVVISTKYS